MSTMKPTRWKQCLQGKVYDPDAFDQAVQWLDEAYGFIEKIATHKGAPIGFQETATELLRKSEGSQEKRS